MTEEQKQKRREYMRNYYKNLSRYQKEKRRLKNLENKKQKYHDKTPEEKAKQKELLKKYFRNYVKKNIERLKVYRKNYYQQKKEKQCLQKDKEKN